MSQDAKWIIGIGVGLYFVWTFMHVLLPILPSPWPPFYWALPVHGQVIDADTGQPLEGVIVAAHWELRDTGWTGSPVGQVAVMEDVTDNKGAFSFRWWRPRLRWRFWGLLRSDAPGLLFFKSGYKWESCSNQGVDYVYYPFPSSDCDETIMKLKEFHGNKKEYGEHLGSFDVSLSFATGGSARDCEWKKIPRLLAALHREQEQLRKERIYSGLSPIETMPNQNRCGSAEKFLQGYLP